MREKLSKIFSSNAFYIVASFLIAILLWLDVAYFRNDTITVDMYDIPIIVVGDTALEDNGFIATSISQKKLNFKVSGKPTEITRLAAKDIKVTLDLETILSMSGDVGTYQLLYTVEFPDYVNGNYLTVNSASADYIAVRVENYVTHSVPIRAEYNAEIPTGYTAEPIQMKQETLSVSGPESLVSSISYALVTIDEHELVDTYSADLPFSYRAETGEEIQSGLLRSQTQMVHVTIPVLMTKEVPLIVNLSGFNSASESNCKVTVEPSSVLVSGRPTRMSSINNIVIANIDVRSFATEFESVYEIVLPSEVDNVSEHKDAKVTVKINGLSTRDTLAESFEVINNNTGKNAQIVTTELPVTLRGKRDVLEKVQTEDIVVQADLSNLKNASGTYSVPAVISVKDAKNVDVVGIYTVKVTIL